MSYTDNKEIWDEVRELCPLFYGVTYENWKDWLIFSGRVRQKIIRDPYLYQNNAFDTPSGKGLLFAAPWRKPAELPDDEYPLILSTVREVGHYSCRSMTGNCKALASLADEPDMCRCIRKPLESWELKTEDIVWVESRRGKVMSRAVSMKRLINQRFI